MYTVELTFDVKKDDEDFHTTTLYYAGMEKSDIIGLEKVMLGWLGQLVEMSAAKAESIPGDN